MTGRVTLVHDYLTQRGGAERVVLAMTEAFPDAPLYVSLYDPDRTFPEFRHVDVRTMPLNRIGPLRRRYRLAMPLLAPAFGRLRVPGDAVICSSSGWAHGVRTDGCKIVYCYNPARWLYQTPRYLQGSLRIARPAVSLLRGPLIRWDAAAASSADRYLVISRVVRERVQAAYGRAADILPPPHDLTVDGPSRPVRGVEPGFVLCVSRLLPYKNVEAICDAVEGSPDERLVVVGVGPQLPSLRRRAGPRVTLLGAVEDDALRWLYANCRSLVAASYEDYGLTPLEAAAFGKPSVVLRFGGFLDTVVEGRTAVLFDEPTPAAIRDAIAVERSMEWSAEGIVEHAGRFGKPAFIARLREVVADALAARSAGGASLRA